ncbi:hypothetical protein IV203_024645 [Nitzschia inconspicua]|uniref:Uncharacterized protein n=1 Tax=Nitzschia inconspicua TaxID=303405 RepID=A0A9K3K404_9STRA|nr:hypothetical protein IV203_024645 [Nitzschia inconspicua]
MVGRTPRHQSQPRPSRPNKAASVDAWDQTQYTNKNGNNALSSYDQRRAKSTMRYQSNGRGSVPSAATAAVDLSTSLNRARVRGSSENYQQSQQQQQYGMSNQTDADRRRAISAGRQRSQPCSINMDPLTTIPPLSLSKF